MAFGCANGGVLWTVANFIFFSQGLHSVQGQGYVRVGDDPNPIHNPVPDPGLTSNEFRGKGSWKGFVPYVSRRWGPAGGGGAPAALPPTPTPQPRPPDAGPGVHGEAREGRQGTRGQALFSNSEDLHPGLVWDLREAPETFGNRP